MVAIAAGLLLLVAQPPIGAWWTTYLAPAALLTALHLRPERSALLGGLAGLAFYGPLLTWLVEPAGAVAWVLLTLIMAGYLAGLAAVLRPFLGSVWLPVVAAAGWVGMDAWRGSFPLGGFEWAAIDHAHVDGSFVLPVARILGGRGITLLVVLVSAAAFVAIRATVRVMRDRDGRPVEGTLGPTRVPTALLVGGLLASVLLTIEPPPEVGELDVVAVQGQDFLWSDPPPAPSVAIADNLATLTEEATENAPADLVVWPEASIERDPDSDWGAPYREPLRRGAAAAGRLLTGVNVDGPAPEDQFHRAAVLYDDEVRELDRYDKRQLVPFGEYVPARDLLDWFPRLERVPRDAIPQDGPSVVTLDGIRMAVLICFETLYPEITRSNLLTDGEPADIIIATTTNSSFGDSSAPPQHLTQSRMRAVETGRWVVHAAQSGASAFVAPDGTAHDVTEIFTQDVIRRSVPLVEGRTPFLVTGDVLGMVARAAAIALVAWRVWWWRRLRPARAATPA